MENLVLSLSKVMNKKNQRSTSVDGGQFLRLGELRKLGLFCVMNIRVRNIMIALKKKI